MRRYTRILYDPLLSPQSMESLQKFGEAVANDSYFTYVNLTYPIQTVALACVLLASARYQYQVPTA